MDCLCAYKSVILKLVVLFCYIKFVSLSEFTMPSYSLRSMCGAHINLKFKNIYTAELTFSSQTNNSAIPALHVGENVHGPPYSLQGKSCDITVESWDFLNKMMIRFEEFRSNRNCSDTSLELFDGLGNFATLEGLPRPVCGHHRTVVMSRSFVTTDKYLTIRIPGNSFLDDSLELKLYITAFHHGRCMSYEYPCANDRCIMGELACNGYDPCGDNSDCPLPTPQEAEDDSPPVLLAAIIALSVAIALVIIGAVVLYRCYRIRRKRRRQEYTQATNVPPNTTTNAEDRSANYQRTESQIEADKRFAPPSYNSLPVHEELTHEEDEGMATEDDHVEGACSSTVQFYEPNSPPDYKCVMEHKEMFHVSQADIHMNAETDTDEVT